MPMVSESTPLSGPPLARRLACAALEVDHAALPPEVLDKAKVCLIDFLSCALEARELPWSRQAIAVAPEQTHAGAPIVGTRKRTTIGDAAFVNAVLGHGLVREDMHAGSIAHLGVVVWPTLLALSARTTVSGGSCLAAAVVGYEAGGRVGRALMTAELARLFRPTGLVGPIAAAVAASRLIGLDETRATYVLSFAANTAGGLNQWPHTGGSEMYFHPGFAARNAVTAVQLAEAGALASEDILEGEAGLFAAFARRRPESPIELFEHGQFEILEVFNKPVPACNFAQTPCQAALRARARLGDRIDALRQIIVRVPEASKRYPGCDFSGPFALALQAKMSIQFGVAAALASGAVAESNYARLDDAEVLGLVDLVRLETDPGLSAAFPCAQGAEIELRLEDGSSIVERLSDVVAATPEQVRDRFRAAATVVLGRARAAEIEERIDELERSDDVGILLELAAADAAAGRNAAR
jgi:2-methylcitrate dehydratase PrpD